MPPFPQGPRFPLLLLPSWESQGVVIHDASLPLSPQFSLSDAPFLGAQGGDQPPLLPVGVGPDWGLAPGPYLILWPFLVSWTIPPMSTVGPRLSGESEHWSDSEYC